MVYAQHNDWFFLGNNQEKSAFSTLDKVLALKGDQLSKDPISTVQRIVFNDTVYYVKIYTRNGKGLRKYLGRGRLRGEWENLLYFSQLDIPTPRLVAYGQRKRYGRFEVGALVTEEVVQADDLLTLSRKNPELLQQGDQLKSILRQVADYTTRIHQQGFVHWDLKWRNILLSTRNTEAPEIYFFDCPLGKIRHGWLKTRGIIKDLACLDKVGKETLSRTQRLRFYIYYAKISRLTPQHKKRILQIVYFFSEE